MFMICSMLFIQTALAKSTIELSENERAWLQQNPDIKFAVSPSQKPFTILQEDGSVVGILPDIYEEIGKLIGQSIAVELNNEETESFHETSIREGVYGSGAAFDTYQNRQRYLLTEPYTSMPFYVITAKKDYQAIRSKRDLKGKRIASLKGHLAIGNYIERAGATLVLADNPQDQMQKVLAGEADALIGYTNYVYLLEKFIMTELVLAFVTKEYHDVSIGVNPEHLVLRGILNKAIKALDKDHIDNIFVKWTNLIRYISPTQIELSNEEQKFIKELGSVPYCIDPQFMPYEHISTTGVHEGIFSDYIDLIARKTSLKFRLIPTESYETSRKRFNEGRCILVAGDKAPASKVSYLTTTPYLLAESGVVVRQDANEYAASFDVGMTGYISGVNPNELKFLIKQHYGTSVDLVPVDSAIDGIRKVTSGELDRFISLSAVLDHTVRNHGISNIKLLPMAGYDVPFAMHVNKDFPMLVSIINKGIEGITPQERKKITDDWISFKVSSNIDYALIKKLVGIFLAVLLVFFVWNRLLNKKVKEATNLILKQQADAKMHLSKLVELEQEKVANLEESLYALVDLIEERDTYTGGHTKRVAKYAKLIAQHMNYSEKACEQVYRAGILHDVGKVSIPDTILLKPGRLTRFEFELMKEHVLVGTALLNKIPMYKELAEIIRYHHERYDGTGYPDGLKEEEIPPLSRILIVADAFDAMTTNRIYKGRKSIDESVNELKRFAGVQFDPIVVKHAQEVLSSIELDSQIHQKPQTDIEEQRFAYFFRDQLTQLHNRDYLDYVLSQNKISDENFSRGYCIYLAHFSQFNAKFGWNAGNQLLIDFAIELKKVFPDGLLFRVMGDDFIILLKGQSWLDNTYVFEVLKDTIVEANIKRLNINDGLIMCEGTETFIY